MTTSTYNDLTARLRKELRSQGYDVEIRPRIETEAGSLTPDLLGRKGGQTLLVGIKSLGTGADEADRMRSLAAFAQAHDDTHFRLVLAEPVQHARELPSLVDVKEHLGAARRLFRMKDTGPAWLFAWALLAAAAARRLQNLRTEAAEGEPPASLVKTLVANGLAAQDDLAWLDAAAAFQERLAAGHVTEQADKALFDRVCGLVQCLSGSVKGENLPDTVLKT